MRDFLHQLGQVGHIGHVPLAAVPGQHPVAHSVELGCLEHRRDADLTGVIGPLPHRLGHAVGQQVTPVGEILGGLAEEHGGRGGADDT